MFVMLVVLCLTYNITDFYMFSINFFTAIFLTPPNTFTAYFFCPKKLTSPLAPVLRITGSLALHGRPGQIKKIFSQKFYDFAVIKKGRCRPLVYVFIIRSTKPLYSAWLPAHCIAWDIHLGLAQLQGYTSV